MSAAKWHTPLQRRPARQAAPRQRPLRQRGLTMIELLVAMVLASIVAYAGVSLYAANVGTAQTTQAVGDLSDSGRVALNFISTSVRSGGYMACNADNDARGVVMTPDMTHQLSILSPGASPMQRDYNDALSGLEASATAPGNALTLAAMPAVADDQAGDWDGGLDGLLTGKVVQGNDVLAVRESMPEQAPVYTIAPYNTGAGQVTLALDTVGNLQPGQFAVVSNCTISTVFQIGAVDSAANTISTDGALDTGDGDLKWSYEYPSSVTPVDMAVYYIGVGRDTDSALFVYHESTGLYQELVPDVENMQVLYGIAPTTPNQVTQYVTANQVTDFNQVISVQIGLLVASQPNRKAVVPNGQTFSVLGTQVTVPSDSRLRKVFTTTMAVQNATL